MNDADDWDDGLDQELLIDPLPLRPPVSLKHSRALEEGVAPLESKPMSQSPAVHVDEADGDEVPGSESRPANQNPQSSLATGTHQVVDETGNQDQSPPARRAGQEKGGAAYAGSSQSTPGQKAQASSGPFLRSRSEYLAQVQFFCDQAQETNYKDPQDSGFKWDLCWHSVWTSWKSWAQRVRPNPDLTKLVKRGLKGVGFPCLRGHRPSKAEPNPKSFLLSLVARSNPTNPVNPVHPSKTLVNSSAGERRRRRRRSPLQ